jgi:hypothetical protein
MTIPSGYDRPIGSTQRVRPGGLLRMIVDWRLLKIPFYKIELVSNSFGKPDKRVNYVEVHPVEWDAQIVFAALKTKIPPVGIPVTSIVDISAISETKGLFRKKEDRMLKITFRANDNSERWLVMDMEDEYVEEFVNTVQALKRKESDELYWTRRSLVIQDNLGLTKTVDIYPLTAFLADGEEIIWQNMLPQPKSKDKINTVQVVTNYRVMQYNYEQHTGTTILLPSIEDITVSNVSHRKGKPIGTYVKSSPFSTIENLSKDTIGDVVFVFGGRPFLSFSQISDHSKLASTVRVMMQNSNMQIVDPAQIQNGYEPPNQPTITTELSQSYMRRTNHPLL